MRCEVSLLNLRWTEKGYRCVWILKKSGFSSAEFCKKTNLQILISRTWFGWNPLPWSLLDKRCKRVMRRVCWSCFFKAGASHWDPDGSIRTQAEGLHHFHTPGKRVSCQSTHTSDWIGFLIYMSWLGVCVCVDLWEGRWGCVYHTRECCSINTQIFSCFLILTMF